MFDRVQNTYVFQTSMEYALMPKLSVSSTWKVAESKFWKSQLVFGFFFFKQDMEYLAEVLWS